MTDVFLISVKTDPFQKSIGDPSYVFAVKTLTMYAALAEQAPTTNMSRGPIVSCLPFYRLGKYSIGSIAQYDAPSLI